MRARFCFDGCTDTPHSRAGMSRFGVAHWCQDRAQGTDPAPLEGPGHHHAPPTPVRTFLIDADSLSGWDLLREKQHEARCDLACSLRVPGLFHGLQWLAVERHGDPAG
jgi:hypothetical protein